MIGEDYLLVFAGGAVVGATCAGCVPAIGAGTSAGCEFPAFGVKAEAEFTAGRGDAAGGADAGAGGAEA